MIEPQRAPVRPRVICPASGEELPLEEMVRSYLETGLGYTLHLQGDLEDTRTALSHLASVFTGTAEVRLSQSTVPAVEIRGNGPLAIVRLQLAPWSRDDWIEYLLARHPARCASVMQRLRDQDEADPLDGSPSLWQKVLDLMAAEEALGSLADAALRLAYSLVGEPGLRAKVQAACLDAVKLPQNMGPQAAQPAGPSSFKGVPPVLVAHAGLRQLIAADKLAADLAARSKCRALGVRLPLAVVRMLARRVSQTPAAMAHLNRLVKTRGWAMAASVLHATESGWIPDSKHLPVLEGAYLSGATWPGASLARLVAYGADLSGADLRRADLKAANLRGANLARACLQGVQFERGRADQACMARADLSSLRANRASFESANLREANLEGASLAQACLEKANLQGVRLTAADLRGARLADIKVVGADLSGTNLTGAKLRGVVLKEARCTGAIFAEADLCDADLEDLDLPRADFTEALLTNALLTGTSIPDGKFDGASLRNAGLAEVDWERVSLRGADLRGASFHLGSSRSGRVGSPLACEGSRTGFYTDDYDEQDFKAPEEIRKANLCGADLRGAHIEQVDFYLVDLRGALLDPDQQEHVRRCGAILRARC
jgi:uncharacterized protein YjbI with pentapeptide repeats